MIKDYDSRVTLPHLIFLGLDESRKGDGLTWKIYSGAPYFALDVTPKGSEEQQVNAKDVISSMEAKGMSFYQTRVVMTFSADEGADYVNLHTIFDSNMRQLRYTPRPEP